MASKRQVARKAWLLSTKPAPLKSCLAEDWEENYTKSDYWATRWAASSKPESELPWPFELRVKDEKVFALDKILVAKARLDQVVQEWHDQRLLHPGLRMNTPGSRKHEKATPSMFVFVDVLRSLHSCSLVRHFFRNFKLSSPISGVSYGWTNMEKKDKQCGTCIWTLVKIAMKCRIKNFTSR